VAEPDRLGEDFVQAERFGDRPPDLGHLEHMRQPRAVMIALRSQEDLRLVLQPAERFAVDDAVPVALIRRPKIVLRLRPVAPRASPRLRRAGNESVVLDFPASPGCSPRATITVHHRGRKAEAEVKDEE
jgi:hypothetical protein